MFLVLALGPLAEQQFVCRLPAEIRKILNDTSTSRPDPANSDNVGKNCIYPPKIARLPRTSTVDMTRLSVGKLSAFLRRAGRARLTLRAHDPRRGAWQSWTAAAGWLQEASQCAHHRNRERRGPPGKLAVLASRAANCFVTFI